MNGVRGACIALLLYVVPLAVNAADETESARAFVKERVDRAFALVNGSASQADITSGMNALIGEAFDWPFMARFSAGSYWRGASQQQRKTYERLFVDYVINSYVPQVINIRGSRFDVGRAPQARRGGDVFVHTSLTHRDGKVMDFVWRVRSKPLRIVDVAIEGSSMLVRMRAKATTMLAREGMSGMIEWLRNEVQPRTAAQ